MDAEGANDSGSESEGDKTNSKKELDGDNFLKRYDFLVFFFAMGVISPWTSFMINEWWKADDLSKIPKFGYLCHFHLQLLSYPTGVSPSEMQSLSTIVKMKTSSISKILSNQNTTLGVALPKFALMRIASHSPWTLTSLDLKRKGLPR